MNQIKIACSIIILFFAIGSFANKNHDLSMYPLPKEGQERIIIELPKIKKEQNLKVEILIGKLTKTDACNSYFLIGELKELDVMG